MIEVEAANQTGVEMKKTIELYKSNVVELVSWMLSAHLISGGIRKSKPRLWLPRILNSKHELISKPQPYRRQKTEGSIRRFTKEFLFPFRLAIDNKIRTLIADYDAKLREAQEATTGSGAWSLIRCSHRCQESILIWTLANVSFDLRRRT